MAQKLLLFWRKPARRCWWEGVELDNVRVNDVTGDLVPDGQGPVRLSVAFDLDVNESMVNYFGLCHGGCFAFVLDVFVAGSLVSHLWRF